MKTRDETIFEASAEGLDVDGWSDEQRDGYYFSKLPLEVRLQNTCPGCGGALVREAIRALALVLGAPKLGRCPACGWTGTKPGYYVATDQTGNGAVGPFATHAEATRQADRTDGYVTTNSGVEGVQLGSPSD